ncbi:MAG: 16S rRNA (guanine(527)-N(7))-methyltransferase RsmG [Alphaproteobacteria bacterium]|nr:16S rRNA (guanine(527)-N(7))-methyltransferase RsmG [Alphaproteobacteria bacterium]
MNNIASDIQEKLKSYQTLLHKWQEKINLVSDATLGNSWQRHFEDSMQLAEHLPVAQEKALSLFDLGSGAGFPGLVLAMMRPDISVHLIESDQKKCSFLRSVSRETKTLVSVHNCRIEELSDKNDISAPDIITARALASLDKLFDYCAPWIELNPDILLIFPKGARADEEIEILEQKWNFLCCTHESKTNEDAKILIISDIYKK